MERNDAMDLCICSSSKTYVPSKTVNLTINKICKKLSFNSGFCLKVFFLLFCIVRLCPCMMRWTKLLVSQETVITKGTCFSVIALYTKAYFGLCWIKRWQQSFLNFYGNSFNSSHLPYFQNVSHKLYLSRYSEASHLCLLTKIVSSLTFAEDVQRVNFLYVFLLFVFLFSFIEDFFLKIAILPVPCV